MGAFKKVAGKMFDVRVDKWMSWDYLGETTGRFKSLLMDIVVPKKATHAETFEEAMQRLNLSEQDVTNRIREFHRLFYFFVTLAAIILGYAMFKAFKGEMVTSLITICLALYALSQAFRFHFWIFQLKNRKLGCSIKEWMNSKILHETSQDILVKEQSQPVVKDTKEKAKDEV